MNTPTNETTNTMTTEHEITTAISGAVTALDASRCAGSVRDAFGRGDLKQAVAQRLLRAANARRDELGGKRRAHAGCPHGQPTAADCNTCAIG